MFDPFEFSISAKDVVTLSMAISTRKICFWHCLIQELIHTLKTLEPGLSLSAADAVCPFVFLSDNF